MTFTEWSRPFTSTWYVRSAASSSSVLAPGRAAEEPSGASPFSHFLSAIFSRNVDASAHSSEAITALWKGMSVVRGSMRYSSSARSMRRVADSRSTSQVISFATIGS